MGNENIDQAEELGVDLCHTVGMTVNEMVEYLIKKGWRKIQNDKL